MTMEWCDGGGKGEEAREVEPFDESEGRRDWCGPFLASKTRCASHKDSQYGSVV
jgi:hypothetical protein